MRMESGCNGIANRPYGVRKAYSSNAIWRKYHPGGSFMRPPPPTQPADNSESFFRGAFLAPSLVITQH